MIPFGKDLQTIAALALFATAAGLVYYFKSPPDNVTEAEESDNGPAARSRRRDRQAAARARRSAGRPSSA